MKRRCSTMKCYEDIALSNKDILQLLDGKASIVLYPQLHKFHNIDQVLGPYGACILLFEAKPKYGHWCCLWKLNPTTVSFFNSYGGYPDDSLEYINDEFRRNTNQKYPILSQLLLDSPYELTYNDIDYQKHKQDIRTCGRHCVVRLKCRNLTDEEYEEFIKYYCKELRINPDELVTVLTV